MTETELLQALGKDDESLRHAKWSPLFLAISDALISRGGLLNFAHEFLRTAVEHAYLPTEQKPAAGALELGGLLSSGNPKVRAAQMNFRGNLPRPKHG